MKLRHLFYLLLSGWFASAFGQSPLHDSVPYQGHQLLTEPVTFDTLSVTKISMDCDWNTLISMIVDLEERIAGALEIDTVFDDYSLTEAQEQKLYRRYDCYVLRDSVLSLQIQLDEALASEPTVATIEVFNIAQTVATLRGAVTDDGNVPLQDWAFLYGPDSNLVDSIHVPFGDYQGFLDTSLLDTGQFTIQIGNLTRYTQYFFTAAAANEEGAGYGDTLSFMTLPDLADTFTLEDLAVDSISATVSLSIGDAGGQGPDSVGFFIGTTDYENNTALAFDSLLATEANPGPYTATFTGLTRYTDYFYSAYATNLAGRALTVTSTFKTLPEITEFDTIFYSFEDDWIKAIISDNGGQSPTSYGMKYAGDEAFTAPTTMSPTFWNITANPFGHELRGSGLNSALEPGKKYWMTASATNDAGTGHSDTLTFDSKLGINTLATLDFSPSGLTLKGEALYSTSPPSWMGFEWGQDVNFGEGPFGSSSFTVSGDSTFAATGTPDFYLEIVNLPPGDAFYYTAFGTNDAGTTYGETLESFTPPLAISLEPGFINEDTITMRGRVEYNELTPTVGFMFRAPSVMTNFVQFPATLDTDSTFIGEFDEASPGQLFEYTASGTATYDAVSRTAYGDTLTTGSMVRTRTDAFVADVTHNSATLSGYFGYVDAVPSEVGFIWSTNPDLSDSLTATSTLGVVGTSDGVVNATATLVISDLTEGETYYFSAYATNIGGTNLGEIHSFCAGTCESPTFDQHVYEVVKIGCQCWFAENLQTFVYANGDSIPQGSVDPGTGAMVVMNETYNANYGQMYNGWTAQDARGLCPNGWHVPTPEDFYELMNFVTDDAIEVPAAGSSGNHPAGKSLKSTDEDTPPFDGTNDVGFNAAPGGLSTSLTDPSAHFWTSLNHSATESYMIRLDGGADDATYALSSAEVGLNVRCLRNAVPDAPVVFTVGAANIDDTQATLQSVVPFNGWGINSTSESALTETGFVWGLDSTLSFTTASVNTTGDSLESQLTGLTRYTDYYFAAYAKNDTLTTFGDTLAFKTTPSVPEFIIEFHASNSTLYAVMTESGGVDLDSIWFKWSYNEDLSNGFESVIAYDTLLQNFNYRIADLSPGAQLYGAALGRNYIGIGSSDTLAFITLPGVNTLPMSGATDTTATLNGQIFYASEAGKPTSVGMQWSVNENFTVAPEDSVLSIDVVDANDLFALTQTFEFSEDYYVRAFATNAAGTRYATPIHFCAGACPSTLTYHGVNYPIVRIGCDCVFGKNLQTDVYVNGDSIVELPHTTDAELLEYSAFENGAKILISDEDEAYYGGYYNRGMFDNALQVKQREFCPPGWSIPTTVQVDSWRNYVVLTDADTIPNASPGAWNTTETMNAFGRYMKASPTDVPAFDGNNLFGMGLYPTGVYNQIGSLVSEELAFMAAYNGPNALYYFFKPETNQNSLTVNTSNLQPLNAAPVRCTNRTIETVPYVFVDPAFETTGETAKLAGIVPFNGWKTTSVEAALGNVGFLVSSNAEMTNATDYPVSTSPADSISLTLNGLTVGQDYWFQAYAENEFGMAKSQVRRFNASPPHAPIVLTNTIENVTVTRMGKGWHKMLGTVQDLGNGTISEAGWKWSLNADLSNAFDTIQNALVHTEVEDLAFELDTIWQLDFARQDLSTEPEYDELLPGATYHYVAFATNEWGTGYGDTLSFYNPMRFQWWSTVTTDSSVYINGNVEFTDSAPDSLGVIWSTSADESSSPDSLGIFQYRLETSNDTTYFALNADSTFGVHVYFPASIEPGDQINWQLLGFNEHVPSRSHISSFTLGECPDVEFDGYTYETVRVFDDCWFSENLRSDNYSNGEPINYLGSLTNPGAATIALHDSLTAVWVGPVGGHTFSDSTQLASTGRLYTTGSVLMANWSDNKLSVCPSGTSIPGRSVWADLSSAEYRSLSGETNPLRSNPGAGGPHVSTDYAGGLGWSGLNFGGNSLTWNGNQNKWIPAIPRYYSYFGDVPFSDAPGNVYWKLNYYQVSVNSELIEGIQTINSTATANQYANPPAWIPMTDLLSYMSPVRCIVDDPTEGPRAKTDLPDVTNTSVTLHGSYAFEGWTPGTEVGFEWGHESDLSDGTEVALTPPVSPATAWSHQLTGFEFTDVIYYRAFARSAAGTHEGEIREVHLGACPSVELDGYTYHAVKVGAQCWFDENLRTTVYNDGSPIASGLDAATWENDASGASSVYGEGSAAEASNLEQYGRLYNWHAVNTGKLCPAGWHVPSKADAEALFSYLDDADLPSVTAAKKLRADYSGSRVWGGSNDYGFNALPGGYRDAAPAVGFALPESGFYWTADSYNLGATAQNPTLAWNFGIDDHARIGSVEFNDGLSVRCLRDTNSTPRVVTGAAMDLGSGSVTFNGFIEDDYWGYPTLFAGFFYVTSMVDGVAQDLNPALASTTTGDISVTVNDLTLNAGDTLRYVAVAENAAGLTYGELSYIILADCWPTEFDGYVYDVKKIGDDCWFTENLRSAVYANGDSLGTSDNWSGVSTGLQSIYDNDSLTHFGSIGRLYNQHAVLDSRGVCPTGWGVAQPENWDALASGNAVKDTLPYWDGTNSTGLSVRLSGYRDTTSFSGMPDSSFFWTGVAAEARMFESGSNLIVRIPADASHPTNANPADMGYAVRCVQGALPTPVVVSEDATDVDEESGVLQGSFTSELPVTEVGFEWGTAADLSGATTVVIDDLDGEFEFAISGLNIGDVIYYRAFATNSVGTAYGAIASFTPSLCQSPTFDGYTYNVVKIGDQCWFAENLRTAVYANGDPIPVVSTGDLWSNSEGAIWDQVGSSLNPGFGGYYTGYTVSDNRGVCPPSWHVPSFDEFLELTATVSSDIASLQASASDPIPWTGTNTTQFNAVEAGKLILSEFSSNSYDPEDAAYWTTDPWNSTLGRYFFMNDGNNYSSTSASFQSVMSIRCIQNEVSAPLFAPITFGQYGWSVDSVAPVRFTETPMYHFVTSKGIVWGRLPDLSDGTDVAIQLDSPLSLDVAGLNPGEYIYAVAYATNELGTGYSDTLYSSTSRCTQPIVYDGYTYEVEELQYSFECWFKENLRTTKYANNDEIPEVTGDTEWSQAIEGARCYYDNDAAANAQYGMLYNELAVLDARGICPTGWRSATKSNRNMSDLSSLGLALNDYANIDDPEHSLADSLQWLAGGYRSSTGQFGPDFVYQASTRSGKVGDVAAVWVSSPATVVSAATNSMHIWNPISTWQDPQFGFLTMNSKDGRSVRCVMENSVQLTTEAATDITSASATLHGTISESNSPSLQNGFVYGTSPIDEFNYYWSSTMVRSNLPFGSLAEAIDLSDYASGTTIYYRLYYLEPGSFTLVFGDELTLVVP